VHRKIALLAEPSLPITARIADRSVDSREQGFIMPRLRQSGYKTFLPPTDRLPKRQLRRDLAKAKVELSFTQYQKRMFDKVAAEQAVREDDVEAVAYPGEYRQATNLRRRQFGRRLRCWKPVQFLASISNSVGSVLKPAGLAASKGILSTNYLKDPTDPT
jgi:hypothetical protein